MRNDYVFTSESVSEGHPDKVSDQISDAIVDLFLSKDPEARVACETLTTTQRVVLAGEVRGKGMIDKDGHWEDGAQEEIQHIVRETVKRIGYEQAGFHWQDLLFENHLHPQSADIAQGVDSAGNKDEGAGDQGIMFGFACDETPDLMPATLDYSHKILERLAADRHSGAAPFLEPDAKSQVTLRFKDGVPVEATAVVVSTQHKAGYHEGAQDAELKAYVKKAVGEILPAGFVTENTKFTSIRPASSKSAALTAMPVSPAARSSSTPTAARLRTAAARSRARTRPRSTVRRPTSPATSPRTSSRPVSPSAARSRSPMRSACPSRSRSTSTPTAPAPPAMPRSKWPSPRSQPMRSAA
jgi:hypothetical protein